MITQGGFEIAMGQVTSLLVRTQKHMATRTEHLIKSHHQFIRCPGFILHANDCNGSFFLFSMLISLFNKSNPLGGSLGEIKIPEAPLQHKQRI